MLVLVEVEVVVLVEVEVDVLVLVEVEVDVLVEVLVEVEVEVLVEVEVVVVVLRMAHAPPANRMWRLHVSPFCCFPHCNPSSTSNEALPLKPSFIVRGLTKLTGLSHKEDFLKRTSYCELPFIFQSCTTGAVPTAKADQYLPAVFMFRPSYPCEYIKFSMSSDVGPLCLSTGERALNVCLVLISSGPLHAAAEKHSWQLMRPSSSGIATDGLSQ